LAGGARRLRGAVALPAPLHRRRRTRRHSRRDGTARQGGARGARRPSRLAAFTRSSDHDTRRAARCRSMARRLAVLACALASLVSVAVLLPAGASANGTRSSPQSGATAVGLGVLPPADRVPAGPPPAAPSL